MVNSTTLLSSSPSAELIQQVSKNWWVLLIRGLLLICIGSYALSQPGMTLASYCWVLGIFVLSDGLVTTIFALTHKMDSKGFTLARGLVTLLIGIFMVGHPLLMGAMVALTLIYILAFHSLVSGALEIYVAIRDRKAIKGEVWMMLSGTFSILFGLILLSGPFLFAKVLIQVSGAFAILFGMVAVFASFRFKALK